NLESQALSDDARRLAALEAGAGAAPVFYVCDPDLMVATGGAEGRALWQGLGGRPAPPCAAAGGALKAAAPPAPRSSAGTAPTRRGDWWWWRSRTSRKASGSSVKCRARASTSPKCLARWRTPS